MRTLTRPLTIGLSAAATCWLTVVVGTTPLTLTPSAMRNHPAIGYQTTPPADPVARLRERIGRGEVRLQFDEATGYLHSVLDALGVPAESQILVFSKTSFQARKINPENPRALFFNDTVSVGWVRGGDVLEFAAQDPRQGTMFYTLDQSPAGEPRFAREATCVGCHSWDATLNVPGMFLGSVFAASDGGVLYAPAFSVDHRTAYDVRWGGWFVTGRHALPSHLGNTTLADGAELSSLVRPDTIRRESLEGRFDPAGYPSLQSDIVALMVMEHQAHMLNLLTRVNWEERLGAEAGRPLQDAIRELVDYLLFVDEAPLPAPVAGTSGFAKVFAATAVRDAQGRSFRDLDLQRRLLRYPCSFLIYSAPFDALPQSVKDRVYARMWDVLSGADPDSRYAVLSPADRRAIVEILHGTKDGLPAFFDPARL
jgi:hypothetical protein